VQATKTKLQQLKAATGAGSSTRPQLEIVVRIHDEEYGHTWNSGWISCWQSFGQRLPLISTHSLTVVHHINYPFEKEVSLEMKILISAAQASRRTIMFVGRDKRKPSIPKSALNLPNPSRNHV